MCKLDGEDEDVILYIYQILCLNLLCRLQDDDEDAAEVSVKETGRGPTIYQNPDNPKIIFVDLPGMGTPTYPDVSTYWKNVGLEDYDIDFFLLFTSTRFKQNELLLANRVRSIGKSFFLIRTKIDNECVQEKRKRRFKEEEMLQIRLIKYDLMLCVRNLIYSEKEIFLIDNYDKDKWDFPRLIAAINGELPVPEGEWSTHSSSNITRKHLKGIACSLRSKSCLLFLYLSSLKLHFLALFAL